MILEAKAKLGDENAKIIAKELDIQDFDEQNLRCCCPFHQEDHASFIYNKKTYSFHCFGACARNYDILDVFIYKGMTYLQACQKLFDLAGIKYSFGELGVKTKHQYKYPKEVPLGDKSKIYTYFKKRCISQNTLDYVDARQDEDGNIVWNYYDTNDVLTMVKYRPSRKIHKGENKCWCQKGADTCNLLFNMNRVNVNSPLLICEGEPDCLSAIEAGFTNAVSVPLGSTNFHWIEENWDWLEQFDNIIVCSDNDEAGYKMQKEVVYRLGSWRTRVVEVPRFYETADCKKLPVNDLNEALYYFGKEKVLDIILNAKDSPVPGVIDFSDIQDIDIDQIDGIRTGIKTLDRYLMKIFLGTLNIITGINGCVSADTEFFTGTGWKPISEYKDGDMVLQYNTDGTTTLVKPEKYHKYPCDKFWKIRSEYGVDQLVSDEHNLVYLTSKRNLAKKSALELVKQHNVSKNGFQGKFITTFDYSGDGIALTDAEIRVMCAVICDGSMVHREDAPTMCRVNIKKLRKQERLERLLGEAGISYQKKHYNPKDSSYSTYLFVPPIVTKSFGTDWYGCNAHQLNLIAEEVLFWDGNVSTGRARFSTTDKSSADFVQFAFSSSGFRSVVSEYDRRGEMRGYYERKSIEYNVSATKSIHPTIFNVKHRIPIEQVESVDGMKYCFTVPSGMLVLRHNGRINITGNSGKSSFINQLIIQSMEEDKNVFLFSGELPNFQTKNWLNSVIAGQRHIEEKHSGEAVYYKVLPDAKRAIDEHYRGRLHIYEDGQPNTRTALMTTIEDAVRKYGVKLVILDNLTAINLECSDDNKYNKQSEFVMELIAFAKKFNVAIILVVHPHKIDTMRRLTKMDVQGISAIIDLAHRIISLYRVQDKDKKGEPKLNGSGWRVPPIKDDVLIDILKDRMLGYEGRSIGVFYDTPSRRFFLSEDDLDRKYSWDTKQYAGGLPYPPPQLEDEEDEVFGEPS